MSNLYDELKDRIEGLNGSSFSIDVINETKNIYEEFKNIVLANPNLRNIYSDRVNYIEIFKKLLFNVVLKNKLQIKYPDLNPLIAEKIIEGIQTTKLDIKDIIAFSEYVFIQGESINDFSHDLISFNANKELIDITNVDFVNMRNNKGLYSEICTLYYNIVDLLNKVISIHNFEDSVKEIVSFDENKILNYNLPRFHIYINSDLVSIINDVKEHNSVHVDVVVEDDYRNYCIFDLLIYPNTMEIFEKDVETWKLSEQNRKHLSKVAKDC